MRTDAIVLLGCRILPGGRLSRAAERRVARAARAFEDGVATRIVASGGKAWDGVCEADAMSRALEARSVPASAITRELVSTTTRSNARRTRDLLDAIGARRVAVVTCDWHLSRALARFSDAGLDALGLPAPSPLYPWHARLYLFWRERVSDWIDRRTGQYAEGGEHTGTGGQAAPVRGDR
jgi:uncharacterized SAM-binding protein YcdF (DUF218 family)